MTRRLALLLAPLLAIGCARAHAPVGGEVPETPPRIVATTPEPGAVVHGWTDPVVIRFDERLGRRGLDGAVAVSPETGDVRVRRGRRELRVSVEGGWRPGEVYRIEVRPGVRDLFGNTREETFELVFSTGVSIPETAIAGFVVDRLTRNAVSGARVEAVRAADSTVYAAATDDDGFFALRFVPPGEYRVRAYRDRNRSRRPDPGEPIDSAWVRLADADTTVLSFALLAPDTTPARLARAEMRDPHALRLTFDDHLDPDHGLAGVEAEIFRLPDSVRVGVAEVLYPHEFEERRRAEEPEPTADPAEPPPAAGPPAPEDPPLEPPGQEPDDAEPGEPEEPLPTRELVVVPAAPLAWATEYEVRITGITNIAGVPAGGGVVQFRTPREPAPPAEPEPHVGEPDPDAAPEPAPPPEPDPAPEPPPGDEESEDAPEHAPAHEHG